MYNYQAGIAFTATETIFSLASLPMLFLPNAPPALEGTQTRVAMLGNFRTITSGIPHASGAGDICSIRRSLRKHSWGFLGFPGVDDSFSMTAAST